MRLFLALLFFTNISLANDCGDRFSNLTSPLCTDARYFFLVGSGITYAAYKSHSTQTERLRIEASAGRPLKESSRIGEILGWGGVNLLYVSYQLAKGYWGNNPYALENAEMATEATLYSSFMTILIKSLFIANRPDLSGRDSFPSGHSSSSFAWASIVMARHEWYYGLSAYLAAAFVAFSRINDQKHYFHDVYGGITIGVSYAWGIFYNHTRYDHKYWITTLPTENLDGMSLNVTFNF